MIHESNPAVVLTDRERRGGDRRQTTLKSIVLGGIGNQRRRGPRRHEDLGGYYVDWYEPRLLAVTLGILVLCCVDALATLTLLSNGANEVNILMDLLIQKDVSAFVHTKVGMTSVGLIYLVAHSSFRVRGQVSVRHVLYLLLGGYIVLFLYQLSMLAAGAPIG